jgi:hypothetical protein
VEKKAKGGEKGVQRRTHREIHVRPARKPKGEKREVRRE